MRGIVLLESFRRQPDGVISKKRNSLTSYEILRLIKTRKARHDLSTNHAKAVWGVAHKISSQQPNVPNSFASAPIRDIDKSPRRPQLTPVRDASCIGNLTKQSGRPYPSFRFRSDKSFCFTRGFCQNLLANGTGASHIAYPNFHEGFTQNSNRSKECKPRC